MLEPKNADPPLGMLTSNAPSGMFVPSGLMPIPSLPPIYAFPVVVAAPRTVSPPPIVEEALTIIPSVVVGTSTPFVICHVTEPLPLPPVE